MDNKNDFLKGLNKEDIIIIQRIINERLEPKKIIEDGIVGPKTLVAYQLIDFNYIYDKFEYNKKKEYILNYLELAEGTHLHWNRGESNFTTMLGIYAKSFPKSEPIKYIENIAKKNNIKRITRKNIKYIDSLLTKRDKENLKHIIYNFYEDNFMNKDINSYLGRKSTLSLFSNSINGGINRGYRSLQSALSIRVDGNFGYNSMKALKLNKLTDDEMNQKLGDYMFSFYNRIARKNAKYKRYINGWTNRLLNLGWINNT